jgi:hypothetical protein
MVAAIIRRCHFDSIEPFSARSSAERASRFERDGKEEADDRHG